MRLRMRKCWSSAKNVRRMCTGTMPQVRIVEEVATNGNGCQTADVPKSHKESINYDHFINDFSRERRPSMVRELTKLTSQRGNELISLAGGLPNPATFPIEEINLRLKDNISIPITGQDLIHALQYIPTQGYPPLLEWMKELQKKMHNPPRWEKTDVLVTPGSQDGISKAIEMILDTGEPMIVQHPVYSGTECVIKPFRGEIIPIEQDKDGLRPDLLRRTLQDRMTPGDGHKRKGFPKLLYVNTTGANPTGVALPLERKKEIYDIACEYNLLILEDDPYYYLHFQEEYPVSFLSMDTEGRVLRFDSFSKIISPGLRVGFTTGPKELIRRMELAVQASSLHASSLSQVIVYKLVESWTMDTFFERFKFIQQFYKERRDAMVKAAEKYLTGLAEWHEPTAGMFLWIKVPVLRDVHHLVTEECIKRGVVFVTGHAYMVTDLPCQYVRASFSLPSLEEIDEGMRRFADAIRLEVEAEKNRLG